MEITIKRDPKEAKPKKKGKRIMTMTAIKRSDTFVDELKEASKKHKDVVCGIYRDGDDVKISCNGPPSGYEKVGTLRFHSHLEADSLTIPEMMGIEQGLHCVGRFSGDVVDDVKVKCYDTPDHTLEGVKVADKRMSELLPKLRNNDMSMEELAELEDIIKARLGTKRKLI